MTRNLAEGDYHQSSLHLLVCPSQDAAQTLANVMFEWSKLDPEKECGVGRYAARGTLRCADAPPSLVSCSS
jgi:hypothetical protein